MGIAAVLIQACSSHSRTAPASSRTNLAHPSIVRNAARRPPSSTLRSLLTARPAKSFGRQAVRLLTQGRDFSRKIPTSSPDRAPKRVPTAHLGRRPDTVGKTKYRIRMQRIGHDLGFDEVALRAFEGPLLRPLSIRIEPR